MTKIWLSVEFAVVTCSRNKCGITWAVPIIFMKKRRNDHKTFYCPNGHSQYYPQKSREEILKTQLTDCRSTMDRKLNACRTDRDEWREEAEAMKRSRTSLKGQITKMRKRMGGNGQSE